jgi:hypothetical protein
MIVGYIAMWGDYLVSPNSMGASRLDLNKSTLYIRSNIRLPYSPLKLMPKTA